MLLGFHRSQPYTLILISKVFPIDKEEPVRLPTLPYRRASAPGIPLSGAIAWQPMTAYFVSSSQIY